MKTRSREVQKGGLGATKNWTQILRTSPARGAKEKGGQKRYIRAGIRRKNLWDPVSQHFREG